jgi:TolA-binding protein
MNLVSKLALGLLLAGALTCVASPAAPQARFGQPGTTYWHAGPVDSHQESAQLAKQYVDSKKEDERREIRKKLTDVLTQQFDEQIQQQQQELEDLEKQIANLRALLKKRLDAKSAIVERRIEQLIQDAEGLGWNAPGTPGGAGVQPFGAYYGRPATPGRFPNVPASTAKP